MKPIRAVVLAGSNGVGEVIKGQAIKNKAFYPINDKPMLYYVLDCLTAVDEVDEIVVVGPKEDLENITKFYSIKIVQQQNSIMENIKASKVGYEHGRILIVTSDIPMITTESVKDFINQANENNQQLFYPIVQKSINEEIFPGVKRTYVTLKEGTFIGGNIFLVDGECIDIAAPRGEKLIELRKSPVKLANHLGWIFLFKLLRKKLSIGGLEDRVSKLLGISVKAIISNYPQLGTDVDKDSDIEIAELYLKKVSNP